MDEFYEKRLTERIPQAGRLDVLLHGRRDWRGQADLVDCSEGGLGIELGQSLKRGTVVILRPTARVPYRCAHQGTDAAPFNLVTAKVRWCREVPSPAGISFFRVGVQRMLPSC